MMDDLKEILLVWVAVVGGTAALFFTIRLMQWLFEGILLGGWF